MIKSFHGFTSFALALGLVSSQFYTLNLLARKDSSDIPNLATLPSTRDSSFSIRSEKTPDKHTWTLASNQHSPKTLLESRDLKEERPGFKGMRKTESYIHKESVAYSTPVIQYNKDEGLSAKEIRCIELKAQGRSNGEMVALGGAPLTAGLTSIPIIGPVLSGVTFGLARRQASKAGAAIASEWNDC